MKTNLFKSLMIFCLCSAIAIPSDAQFKSLKDKLKKKAENAAKSVLGDDDNSNNSGNNPSSSPNQNSGSNSSVQGKKLTPPNVMDHLGNAKSALGSEQYSNARFEIKEAMRGVELEIGYKLLEMMPPSAAVLYPDKDKDQVYSAGVGFVGLVVSRTYGTADKIITATIGDNSVYGASYSMLINSSYAANDGNHKNVTVQGNRGAMTFDGNNTYTLGVPLAQNSVFIMECRGCKEESEVMTAVDDFSLSGFTDLLTDNSTSTSGSQQDASALLASASSHYSSKDLESTRYDLQRSLVEVDVLIGKMILGMLPTQLNGLAMVEGSDEHVASAAGFAGVYVIRTYESADKSQKIEFSLIDDSPLMGAVSTFLSSPLMVGLSGKKTIKVDGYKGMFEQVEGSDPVEHNVSIPNNQSLLTLNFLGVSEADANRASAQVPVGQIFGLIK